MQAPKDFTPIQAIKFAEITSLGGSEQMARALLNTRIGTEFSNERKEFYDSIIRYFVKHPMLDIDQYGPIIDYVIEQKYGGYHLAAKPNLVMKDRDPNTLLREVDNWHKMLGEIKATAAEHWGRCSVEEFTTKIGSNEHAVEYNIQEIINKHELVLEGKKLRHCVATYASSCKAGYVSIWSLWSKDYLNNTKKLITIALRQRSVVETRGFANRRPNAQEINIIYQWSRAEGIAYSPDRL